MNKKEFVRLFDLSEYRFLAALSLGKRLSEQLLKDTNNLLENLNDEINWIIHNSPPSKDEYYTPSEMEGFFYSPYPTEG